jgi:anti-anti-sigma factor
MRFQIFRKHDTARVMIEGELDAVSCPDLRQGIEKLLASHPKHVIIDLSLTRMLDSSGVGAIVSLYKRVRSRGGDAEVKGLRDQPLATFRLLRLDRVIDNLRLWDSDMFPSLPQERTLSDLSERMLHAKRMGESTTLLMGAGCSVSAGIPAAAGMVERIRTEFPSHYDRAIDKSYTHVMNELNRAARYSLIHQLVSQAKINWCHVCVAWLLKTGYVGRVYTTNFDDLLVKACGLFGVSPAVYDVSASKPISETFVREPAIFYLHGRHHGMVQFHTPDDFRASSENLRELIQESSFRRPWIVAGYGGLGDPVFDRLSSVSEFTSGLYWTTFRVEAPQPHVREQILTATKQGYFCRITSADRFFDELLTALGERPLLGDAGADRLGEIPVSFGSEAPSDAYGREGWAYERPEVKVEADLLYHLARLYIQQNRIEESLQSFRKLAILRPSLIEHARKDPFFKEFLASERAAEFLAPYDAAEYLALDGSSQADPPAGPSRRRRAAMSAPSDPPSQAVVPSDADAPRHQDTRRPSFLTRLLRLFRPL